jgi:hypothetical protein
MERVEVLEPDTLEGGPQKIQKPVNRPERPVHRYRGN